MNPVEAPTKKWTQTAIETLALELVAEEMGEDPATLKVQLGQKGEGMPIDSLEMFDMLADFRKQTGLRIPVKKLQRNTLRSIRAFAEFAAKEAS